MNDAIGKAHEGVSTTRDGAQWRLWCNDQGMHNVLLWTGKFGKYFGPTRWETSAIHHSPCTQEAHMPCRPPHLGYCLSAVHSASCCSSRFELVGKPGGEDLVLYNADSSGLATVGTMKSMHITMVRCPK